MKLTRILLEQIVSRLRLKGALRFLYALEKVGHPSEVAFPIELLPSGVKMHLRGFMTFHSVQINLDWVWPYWIVQQFDPASTSFIPRAMNLTHVNQTHRNWTAVGVLGGKVEPIVDPRGLLTPWFDGWSLDVWLYKGGRLIAPSQLDEVHQSLRKGLPIVTTSFTEEGLHVSLEAWGARIGGHETVIEKIRIQNLLEDKAEARLYLSARPYNPEGMSLIRHLDYHDEGVWEINHALAVVLPQLPERVTCSDQRLGDVSIDLPNIEPCKTLDCEAGMATALSEYTLHLAPGEIREFTAICTTNKSMKYDPKVVDTFRRVDTIALRKDQVRQWSALLSRGMTVTLPDGKLQECFHANKAFLHLFDDGEEITPGPLTYHRFWFRDATFLINALDKLGYGEEARTKLKTYPGRQRKDGFFISQNGEWDSNGEAIWTLVEHYRLNRDAAFLEAVYPSIRKGIFWIERKRKKNRMKEGPGKGLLPPGLSAEHLGPNDYFYWDDFWSLAGIRDGKEAAEVLGKTQDALRFERMLRDFWNDLNISLRLVEKRLGRKILPASPFRRMDSGAIGSIVALYPLRLMNADDEWIVNTVDYLRRESFYEEGFFQNMIHSGVNPYLTGHIAHCYIYRRKREAWPLIYYLQKVATSTYTWPEAIHPRTGGGCMGDGHHGWAAAELLLLVRNLLFFEEGDRLVLTPILPKEWSYDGAVIEVKGGRTYFGPLDFRIVFEGDGIELEMKDQFWTLPSSIEWNLPFAVHRVQGDSGPVEVREKALLLPAKTRQVKVWIHRERVEA
jgi:hypothetical protein